MVLQNFLSVPSPVGNIVISGTEEAINAISFAEVPEKSSQSLPPLLHETAQQLQEYFAGTRKEFDLPLYQIGTEFQQRVWQELLNVKFGQTLSYKQLAEKLGNAKAVRAIGPANGKNAIGIVVPCHRIIGSNGNLVGYAGGLWRKQWLLEHEIKYSDKAQQLQMFG